MKLVHTLRRTIGELGILTIAFTLALMANLVYGAVMAEPTAAPPLDNVPAPINSGDLAQVKSGPLSVDDALTVYGWSVIRSGAPTLMLFDDNHDNWFIHANSDQLYFIHDVNNNGEWCTDSNGNGSFDSGECETPWPLVLNDTFAQFGSKVQATQYCNYNGTVCFDASNPSGIPTCASGQILKSNGSAWICGIDENSTGGTTCPSDSLVNCVHSKAECTAAGGTVVYNGTTPFCRFNSSSCPAGWAWYNGYSTYVSNTCGTNSVVVGCSEDAMNTKCTAYGSSWAANNGASSCSYFYCNNPKTCTADRTQIGCY